MKKHKEDDKRGAMYRAGVAPEEMIPAEVIAIKIEKKKKGNIECKLYGCHNQNHKTQHSKKCFYNAY